MKGFIDYVAQGAWVLGLLLIYAVMVFGVVGGVDMALNGNVGIGFAMVVASIASIVVIGVICFSNESRGM